MTPEPRREADVPAYPARLEIKPLQHVPHAHGARARLQEHDQSGPGAGRALSSAQSEACLQCAGPAQRRHRGDDRQSAPARFPGRDRLAGRGTDRAGREPGASATGEPARLPARTPVADAPGSPIELFVANSGTSMRFLAAMVSLGQGRFRLDGVPRMRRTADRRPALGLAAARRQGKQRKQQRLSAHRHRRPTG